MLSAIFHEICQIETEKNSVESHIACTDTRQQYDNQELHTLLTKLKKEEIFSPNIIQFRKLLSGKIVHNDIIENISTSFVCGQKAMLNYIWRSSS